MYIRTPLTRVTQCAVWGAGTSLLPRPLHSCADECLHCSARGSWKWEDFPQEPCLFFRCSLQFWGALHWACLLFLPGVGRQPEVAHGLEPGVRSRRGSLEAFKPFGDIELVSGVWPHLPSCCVPSRSLVFIL